MQLELVKKEMFGEVVIDLYQNDNNDIFMTVEQIAQALGYSNKSSVDSIISRNPYLKEEEFSNFRKLQAVDGKFYQTRLLNENGIRAIISTSERPIVIKRKVARAINPNWSFFDYLTHRVEDEYIHLIQTVFKAFRAEREVIIGKYRCDLFFPEYRLVIECDEHGHRQYDKKLEFEREKYIENQGYYLFRFNPHEQDFYIGDTLREILEILLSGNNKNKKEVQKNDK